MRRLLFAVTIAAAAVALADGGDEGLVEQEGYNPWHFRIGPVMSPRVRTKLNGPASRTSVPKPQTRTVSSPSGSTAREGSAAGAAVPPPSAGYVARQYSDGYVNPDEGTDDPGSMINGLTWDWGADNVPAQYSGGRIEFKTDVTRWSESESTTVRSSGFSMGGGAESKSDRDILLGVEAMGGWTFFDDTTFDAALDGGFRFYGSGDLRARAWSGYGYATYTTTTKTRSEYRYVDSYDASGWATVPAGSHVGTPGGPGRLIGAAPTRREELAGTDESSETHVTQSYSYSRSSAKLDYKIWDMRLGPTLGWKAMDRLTIRGGVYGLLGLVDAKLKGAGATYGGRSSKCEAVFGVAAGLSAQFNFTDSLFLVGGAEYDWWADDVRLKAGGADARIKLSDFSLSLSLGIEF